MPASQLASTIGVITTPASAPVAPLAANTRIAQPLGVDAHQPRRLHVDRARAHRAADGGALQEQEGAAQQQRRRAPHPQALHRQDGAARYRTRRRRRPKARAGSARPCRRRSASAAQHHGKADRGGDLDEMRHAPDRRQGHHLLQPRRRRHRSAQAARIASPSGTSSPTSQAAAMPPSMTNSPCAKFTTPETLAHSTKPSATSA